MDERPGDQVIVPLAKRIPSPPLWIHPIPTDDGAPRLALLVPVQRVVLELDTASASSGEAGTAAGRAVVASGTGQAIQAINERPLNTRLELMESLIIAVLDEVLDVYDKAMDDVPRYEPGPITRCLLK